MRTNLGAGVRLLGFASFLSFGSNSNSCGFPDIYSCSFFYFIFGTVSSPLAFCHCSAANEKKYARMHSRQLPPLFHFTFVHLSAFVFGTAVCCEVCSNWNGGPSQMPKFLIWSEGNFTTVYFSLSHLTLEDFPSFSAFLSLSLSLPPLAKTSFSLLLRP